MTLIEFRDQIERFKKRFGEKAFDEEFIKLVWRECKDLSQQGMTRLADVMIGSRNHTRPPSIVDFREARIKEQKHEFDREVAGAARAMDWPAKGGLQRYLAQTYGSECKTLNQAVEMQVELNRMERMKQGQG